MKKHFLTPLTALLLLAVGLLVCGCEKEPPPPPDPPKPPVEKELSPIIEVNKVAPEGLVPYGDSVTFKYKNINTKEFWVDGQIQTPATEGTFVTGPVCGKTTFWLLAKNVELTTSKYVEILEVGPWYETTFGLVSYYPWRYKAFRISSLDGEVLYFWIPDPEILSWVFYFHKDGKLTFSSNLSGNTETWLIKNDGTIILMIGVARKLQVDPYEMVISYQTTYNGETVWFDMVFEHASDTPTDPD